nr:PREDICTED: NADH dehydrogenase [ubiquinone] 1 alpha subcomplex assembly factor 5 [Bemisia tabaci]
MYCALMFSKCFHSVTSRFIGPLKRSNFNTSLSDDSPMKIFDRTTKFYQKERAAQDENINIYDYLKDEVGYRLCDRIFDINRKFKTVIDLGCGRGHVSKHMDAEAVEEVFLCESSPTLLSQAATPETAVKVTRVLVDEENLPFASNSVDLVVSSLSLSWVNNLPGTFCQIIDCLKNDGVFIAAFFGGDTLYELRSSLQLADLERNGGVSPHISPFVKVQDIGSLLNRAGFTMLTIDTDEIVVGYPSMFELMQDLKGMGESNAARRRNLHLSRNTMLAAASIYETLYGNEGKIQATFQLIFLIGWKPDASQPKPLQRGSYEFSLKDLHKIDEIAHRKGIVKDSLDKKLP